MLTRLGATMDSQFDVSHWAGHIVSVFALLGSLVGILPALAGAAAFIWYAIQIVESDTVQKRMDKWRVARKLKRIMKLMAEHKMLTAELDAMAVVREAREVAADKVAAAAAEARRQLANEVTATAVKDAVQTIVKSTPTV